MDILEKALNGIASIEKNITDSISSFHFYEYDGHPYDIHDGGHGMYDSIGNKVSKLIVQERIQKSAMGRLKIKHC